MPSISIGQSDPTLTVYNVQLTVSWTSGTVTSPTFTSAAQPIHWSPEYTNEPVAPAPIAQMYLSNSKYYWSTSYHHFNTALAAARDSVQSQFATWYVATLTGTVPTLAAAPKFAFNGSVVSVIAPKAAYSQTRPATGDSWNLKINEPLKGLFNYFPSSFDGTWVTIKVYDTPIASGKHDSM